MLLCLRDRFARVHIDPEQLDLLLPAESSNSLAGAQTLGGPHRPEREQAPTLGPVDADPVALEGSHILWVCAAALSMAVAFGMSNQKPLDMKHCFITKG